MLQIYLLKDDRCGHCSQFQPTWIDLQNSLKTKANNIEFITIGNMFDIAEKIRNGEILEDLEENKYNIAKKYYTKGVPTLIGKNAKNEEEYSGIDRNYENVENWIKKLIVNDNKNDNNNNKILNMEYSIKNGVVAKNKKKMRKNKKKLNLAKKKKTIKGGKKNYKKQHKSKTKK